jgi:hypothetical protein
VPIRLYDTAVVDYSLPNGIDAFKGNGRIAGRKNIRMTAWGPYDFRYPLLWNTNPTDTTGKMAFDVLGPKGKWKIVSAKGVNAYNGVKDTFPSTFSFAKVAGKREDIVIVAEYTGPAFTDAFGNNIPAGKPYRFEFRKFFQPIDFTVSYYDFDSSSNPIKTAYAERLKIQRPFKVESVDRLDYAWWGGVKTDTLLHKQFLVVAEGTAAVEKGEYELAVTWDDAVRVYVDGKLLFNEWNPSKNTFDEAPNRKIRISLGGTHTFRVEHAELGGFAALSLRLNKL